MSENRIQGTGGSQYKRFASQASLLTSHNIAFTQSNGATPDANIAMGSSWFGTGTDIDTQSNNDAPGFVAPFDVELTRAILTVDYASGQSLTLRIASTVPGGATTNTDVGPTVVAVDTPTLFDPASAEIVIPRGNIIQPRILGLDALGAGTADFTLLCSLSWRADLGS